ncbi:coiled-coil domain-containing protein 171 [Eurytemora carolleeae]|uniref:coiled-coil domain-containing protein 171 n=1 Tax=Eurytemora carolleeae TaxID=1294199 RepID=UPI000C763EC0|nr:coiled-coil domain-containing protein 171 [Eurytemora carolleeae]|eukprot:XP_023320157.1 coiled-coil domain-containing protein 171-like [Eurytemora affinis]
MSKKPKGPSVEDTLSKFEEKFRIYQEEQEKLWTDLKENQSNALRELQAETEKRLQELKDAQNTQVEESKESQAKTQEEWEIKWQDMQTQVQEQMGTFQENKNKVEELQTSVQSLESAAEDSRKMLDEGLEALQEKIQGIKVEECSALTDQIKELQEKLDQTQSLLEEKLEAQIQDTSEKFSQVTRQQEESDHRTDQYFSEFKDELESLNSKIDEVLDNVGMTIQDKLKETNSAFQQTMTAEAQNAQSYRAELDFDINGIKEKVEILDQGINELQEKLYEFEQNKKNNLIFYGITNDSRETPEILLTKIQNTLRITLGIRRDIPVTKVSRMYTGPEVSGSRPVLVTFEQFKDREEVFRKGNMLKGSSIHLGEDLSKRTRESRTELRKYMRKVKRGDPSAACFIQHDKLYVNNRIFVWNDLQGKVVQQSQLEDPLAMSIASMIMSRPGSVMDDRPGSALSIISPTKTPVRSRGNLNKSISLNGLNTMNGGNHINGDYHGDRIRELEEMLHNQQEEFQDKMKDFETIIRKQDAIITKLQGEDET